MLVWACILQSSCGLQIVLYEWQFLGQNPDFARQIRRFKILVCQVQIVLLVLHYVRNQYRTMTMSTSSSIRYQQLVKGVDKVLVESRNSINVNDAVQAGYGDEASVFGEGQIGKVFEGMLDVVHSSVTQDMAKFLDAEHVERDLIKVEEVLKAFDKMEHAMQELNHKDRESARNASINAQLPDGVKPMDVVKYRAYGIMKDEKDKLTSLIEKYQQEIRELEKLVSDAQSNVQSEILKVEEVSRELDRTADVCATLS
jgi:hypothetical protein